MLLIPRYYLIGLISLFLLANSLVSFAADKVGIISFSRGTVAAHHGKSSPRLLGKDSDVFEGDNIQTSDRSFVIIDFSDGTKLTVRPNSSFTVDQVSNDDTKMTVHQGGVRASSSESQTENIQITTPNNVINVQQADVSVRVCQGDECQQEGKKSDATTEAKKEVIARIVELKGLVTAINADDVSKEERLLTLGAPLYSTDKLSSGPDAYAVIVFKDKARITLDYDSVLDIKDYKFGQKNSKDNAVYELISGGMRVLSGSIGKKDKSAFKVNTPVATIGIRGTGFDLIDRGQGLYSAVWQGAIYQQSEAGTFDLASPKVNFIQNPQSMPKNLPALPQGAHGDKSPRPDAVEVKNESNMFGSSKTKKTNSGTYVEVSKGSVSIESEDGSTTELNDGESSFSNTESQTLELESTPAFMQEDPYPIPNEGFSETKAETTGFSLLSDGRVGKEAAVGCQCK